MTRSVGENRRRTFCVGLPKCGTHSVADMLSGVCRTAHEPEAESLLPMLQGSRSGAYSTGELRSFFHDRDRRLSLDVESNHLLASFVPHLVDAFPDASYILVVRECRAWIDSMINDQLNLRRWEGYPRWKVVYDQYLVSGGAFPPEERVLEELDLYPLNHYVRYWRDEVGRIKGSIPTDRLLVLRTEELSTSVPRLAGFVGVPASAVVVEQSHSYRSPRRHNVLDAIPAGYVSRLIAENATSLLG